MVLKGVIIFLSRPDQLTPGQEASYHPQTY